MSVLNFRARQELYESEHLSPFACQSARTAGREEVEENECDIRTAFQSDRDRIIHCKAFRRLTHKTQVFISPEGDHYRTRLTHTLEVAQISRTIARSLRLNEDLTEAIAFGHDLGHTPFGHTGEEALDTLMPGGFSHNRQSLRVVRELNLTAEVRDGILNHRTHCSPSTLEGKVVQICDKIAYVNHDIDDALRANVLNQEDLPGEILAVLGETSPKRIDFLVRSLITASDGINDILLPSVVKAALTNLRAYLFSELYATQLLTSERKKIKSMLGLLFSYYCEHENELPPELLLVAREEGIQRAVCDYIAGMTDRFAMNRFNDLFLPAAWRI